MIHTAVYILQQKRIVSAVLGTRFYNFKPPIPTRSSQTPHPKNFQLSEQVKNTIGYLRNSWTSCFGMLYQIYSRLGQQLYIIVIINSETRIMCTDALTKFS